MFKTIINKLKEFFCKEDNYEFKYETYDKLSDYPQYAGEETEDNH